jgi:hypothetical protein
MSRLRLLHRLHRRRRSSPLCRPRSRRGSSSSRRREFERRGLAPEVLSRAVEDSGTVTSVLVPWNTCGAYISCVLGVPTASYLPYCYFNLLSPVLDVLFGFIGFKVPSRPSSGRATEEERPAESGTVVVSGQAPG